MERIFPSGFRFFKATDIGLYRETNEDSIAAFDGTFVVADGMGGYAAGEVASGMLTDSVLDTVIHEKFSGQETLKRAILRGNSAIIKRASKEKGLSGMGTTATVFRYENCTGYWAHVGDSRLYLMRDGDFRQITRDHSLVSDLVASGSITKEEAKKHPKRNVITRAVGVDEILEVDTGSFPVFAGDIVLIASDGLTSVVPDDMTAGILTRGAGDIAASLVRRAKELDSHDNISVIVIIFDDRGAAL